MNAIEVRGAVSESLAPLLVPKGFRPGDWGCGSLFRRVRRGVRQTVSLRLVDHAPTFQFLLDFLFRVDAAEAIFQRFVEVTPQFRKVTETCFVPLNRLVPSVGDEVVVDNKRSLRRALSALRPALERHVLPFLDANQDLHSIDRLLNGSTREWFVSALAPYISMNSVIVARLAGNPDWEELASMHRERFTGRVGDEELTSFERLVRYLARTPASVPHRRGRRTGTAGRAVGPKVRVARAKRDEGG